MRQLPVLQWMRALAPETFDYATVLWGAARNEHERLLVWVREEVVAEVPYALWMELDWDAWKKLCHAGFEPPHSPTTHKRIRR